METNEVDEIERICHNCNSHFPTSRILAETAICLNNPVFEQYIDELIENYNYDCCQELIDKYQFPNEQKACPDFDPIDMSDVEDIGEEKKAELLNTIKLECLFDIMKKDDYPIEKLAKKLYSEDKEERKNALSHLGVVVGQKNKKVSKAICDYYCTLSPATTLEDVYRRIDILKKINYIDNKKEVFSCIVNELNKTFSNNTTRSLFNELFRIMRYIPPDIMRDDLEKMITGKKFSYRLKNKMKDLLEIYE